MKPTVNIILCYLYNYEKINFIY